MHDLTFISLNQVQRQAIAIVLLIFLSKPRNLNANLFVRKAANHPQLQTNLLACTTVDDANHNNNLLSTVNYHTMLNK
ncbi:hypothetical protein ACX27_15340 [Nostoc piscinale CENA21]|uniref:Uncharacterized protein n=1 Tax=Nostoc piscinale CENA21 TaxID=224013 RepID=A0A0M3V5M3_9NOSO|nr:hypothetical protein ACX27_15340 [Nostoc piscinale CENA21]